MMRTGAILLGGLLALWIAIGVTINLTSAAYLPKLGEAVWPVGVTAKVTKARQLIVNVPDVSKSDIAASRIALREAALREPNNTQVLGALAALDDYIGDKHRARVLFSLSEAVSRRNSLTEMWLIEDSVARGDIRGAIRHYDRAMRVSVDLRPTLLPVLAAAASNRDINQILSQVLAQRPLWWTDYIQFLGRAGADPQVMAAALGATRPDLRQYEERALAEGVLRRMIALKDERAAIVAANKLEGLGGITRTLRGGSFDVQDGVLPFAWWLRDEADIRAYRDTVPRGGMGLHVTTTGDTSGGAAQQLVGLAAGGYSLSGIAGGVSSDPANRPGITVNCLNGTTIGRFELPPSPHKESQFAFKFEVPRDCITQWINVVTAPVGDTDIWIDDVAIRGMRVPGS
ncbi:hypothetical protein HCH44_17155 [Sphingomonas melonis]|uniref:hypothetical protein n=1 Tax=Sphingomonas melonis TaxID=152682 RepID=UPI001C8C9E9B|nr:hypothetical protein [Sphingomonas melonis]MBX8846632.1 hypothetical protein [Sphingomonas melonis]MBX8855779.1 hypothetical protein [Sphingomonas melonis]MBX8900868.1 hypothetical protein [Sphingomonas melonis]